MQAACDVAAGAAAHQSGSVSCVHMHMCFLWVPASCGRSSKAHASQHTTALLSFQAKASTAGPLQCPCVRAVIERPYTTSAWPSKVGGQYAKSMTSAGGITLTWWIDAK